MDSGIDLDGFALPVANKENKELQLEVERKQKEISSLKRQSEEYADRIQAISDHLKNVQQELQHTQALHDAKRKDVDVEQHLRQIAEREEGRLREELKKIEAEESEIKERINMYENTTFKNKKRIEVIKAQMNWEQQTLDSWLEESARKDDNAMTIEKYSRADEGKVKDLTLKLEHCSEEMQRRKKALDSEVTDTITAQIEVDNIAKAFRLAHDERQELVQQWEQTIEQMKKRDQDMDKCALEIAGLKAEVRSKEDLIEEKEEFLSQEQHNNKEMEKKAETSEREVANLRLKYQEAEASRIEFRDELETLKYNMERTASDVETMQARSKQLSREVKDKSRQVETLKHQRQLMQEELKTSTKKTLSAEERAHQMDEVLSSEEAKLAQLEKEVALQREKQFKKAQELFELNTKHSNMESELQGTRVALRNLRSKQHKLDEEAMKQQEILYTQDFQLQQMQHKMSRLEGERTGDERAKLTERIKTLEEDWGRQQQSEQLLRNQLKRSQDDLLRAGRHLETRRREKDTMKEKIDEINLHIDNTQRESKKVVKQKQDWMVDENILKLQIKRLRNTLYSHADEVLSLEQREKQLETTMAERTREISVHKEMLRTQCKGSEQERQTVTVELQDRISKVDRLRKRYEILTVSMQPPDGEGGGEQSQAYYVIKAAQEREDLQRTGDELDAKIKKSEREIRAMENTLQLMNSKNERYRKSLHRVDGSSEEVVQLEGMEGQLQTIQGKLRHRRKQAQQLAEDLKSMEKTLSTLAAEEAEVLGNVQQKQGRLTSVHKELEELKGKQDRAEKQILKVMKELRAKESDSALEQDIQLRELKAFSTNIIQYLSTLATSHPESASTLNILFSQYGVAPPPSPAGSRTGSRTGSLPASARSSRVSLSSSRTSVHSIPHTPSSPLQTKTVNLSQQVFSGVTGSPKAGSALGSASSSRRPSKEGSRETSRPPSNASSRHSSKPPSRTQSSSSRKGLDLTIGPS